MQLGLQLADKIHTEPILISHLVRIAMVQLMLQPVWEGLAQHKWSDAQLAALEAELGKLDFCADYRLSMHCELGFQSDILRIRAPSPGEAAGIGRAWLTFPATSPVSGLPSGLPSYLIPAGWLYQNQYRCARVMEDYYVPMADVSQGTFRSGRGPPRRGGPGG